MSALEPSGSAQPPKDEVYTTTQNPASKAPAEVHSHPAAGKAQDVRSGSHSDTSQAVPSSLGQGIHGAPPATSDPANDTSVTNAEEKMQPLAEDHIADAVEGVKPGSGGAQPGLESNLDRKKAEQAPLRDAMQDQRKQDIDVGGILGQRGGPANPVDKNNYPNTN